jgi:hypothetical protein
MTMLRRSAASPASALGCAIRRLNRERARHRAKAKSRRRIGVNRRDRGDLQTQSDRAVAPMPLKDVGAATDNPPNEGDNTCAFRRACDRGHSLYSPLMR